MLPGMRKFVLLSFVGFDYGIPMMKKVLAMISKICCFSYFMYLLSKIIDTDIVCLQIL